MKNEPNKKDILLVLLDMPTDDNPLMSPIQIMKSMFLVKNELNLTDFYQFEPYLYGPCSFEIYTDLISLSEEKLIEEIKTPFSWNYYKTTLKGKELSRKLATGIEKNILKKIQEIKKLVVCMNLIELLRYVYEKHPEFAVNSIIKFEVFKE